VIFCPDGATTPDVAADYLSQPNVACIGGSWLTPAPMLCAGDWVGIEALAREAMRLRK